MFALNIVPSKSLKLSSAHWCCSSTSCIGWAERASPTHPHLLGWGQSHTLQNPNTSAVSVRAPEMNARCAGVRACSPWPGSTWLACSPACPRALMSSYSEGRWGAGITDG